MLVNKFRSGLAVLGELPVLNSKVKHECFLRVLKIPTPSQAFGNVCNAYAKAINKAYERTGSLFENPFGRIPVNSDAYFHNLITYIHRNPQTHGLVDDFQEWPYSSYDAILHDKPTRISKMAVLD